MGFEALLMIRCAEFVITTNLLDTILIAYLILRPVPLEMTPLAMPELDEGLTQASRVKAFVMLSVDEFGTVTWLPTDPGKNAA